MTKHVRVWFDGVSILEVAPLVAEIVGRGWQEPHAIPGEWWCQVSRSFDDQAAFDRELEELKRLFGERWSRFGIRHAPRIDVVPAP